MYCSDALCRSRRISTLVFDTEKAEAFQRLRLEEGWAAVVPEKKRGNAELNLDQEWGSGKRGLKLRDRLMLMVDGYKKLGYKGGGEDCVEYDLFEYNEEPENRNELLLLLARLECARQEGGAEATYASKSELHATKLDLQP